MGLDGISVNSLRITPENTSRESAIVADNKAKLSNGAKTVDSLDKKSAITGDDKENTSFFGGGSGFNSEEDEEEKDVKPFEKLDLSNKENYEIVVDESSSTFSIHNKKTNSTIQEISPQSLSELVETLKTPEGIMVNKRA